MALQPGSIVFLDTNILLIATDEGRPHHADARHVLKVAPARGIHLAISGQVIREYLVVATRPTEANGLGLDATDALANTDVFLRQAVLYDETERVSERLRDLVRDHALTGVRIHDANIAATMLTNGLDTILTQNVRDFSGLDGVHPLTLADVIVILSTLEADDSI